MIKEKKSLKASRSPSRRKFFKTAAATGVAAVAASSLSAPAVAKERIEASMVATWPRDFPGLGTGAQRLAQRLSDMSDGRIQVTYYAANERVKAFDSFDEVASRSNFIKRVECFYPFISSIISNLNSTVTHITQSLSKSLCTSSKAWKISWPSSYHRSFYSLFGNSWSR